MSQHSLVPESPESARRRCMVWPMITAALFLNTAEAADPRPIALKPAIKAARYTFTVLDLPGYKSVEGISINAAGEVLVQALPKNGAAHYSVYHEGIYLGLSISLPGAIAIAPQMMNDAGMIAGVYATEEINDLGIPVTKFRGFLFDSGTGTATPFDAPGGSLNITLWDMNAQGQVVGSFQDSSTYRQRGFSFQGDRFEVIDQPAASETIVFAINDFGAIAGRYSTTTASHGLVGTVNSTETFDCPTEDSAIAMIHIPRGINNDGEVLGQCYGFGPSFYVYRDGQLAMYRIPDAYGAKTEALSDAGWVTGSYWGKRFRRPHGFLFRNGRLQRLDVPGARATSPKDINASGQITGSFVDGSGTHGFVAAPVK